VPLLPSLRRVREAKLLTQQELADRAGVHRVTIASLETTAGAARFSTIRKLAAALEVDPSKLMQPEGRDCRATSLSPPGGASISPTYASVGSLPGLRRSASHAHRGLSRPFRAFRETLYKQALGHLEWPRLLQSGLDE
jgi:transcriptional regulator with XRE-family HTH domain